MTAEPNPKPENSAEGKRRRLTLMESYDPELSAFSNSKLSEISDAIRVISTPHEVSSPSDEAHGESPDVAHGESHGETLDQSHSKTSNEIPASPLDESPSETLSESPSETASQTPDETSGKPSGQIVRPLFGSPSHSPLGELSDSPSDSPGVSSSGLPRRSPLGESLGEIMILTSNQALLYECTKILEGRFTTLARISQVVNISVDTLRSCLRKLRKIGVVSWSVENISGQNGMRISATEIAYTVRGNRTSLDEKMAKLDYTQLALNSSPPDTFHQVNHHADHQIDHQMSHHTSYSSSSSTNKIQLQELETSLLLEGHFQGLDIRSLEPYSSQFESIESLQNFLDMANASIDAAASSNKPIQNPRGFLFAQLRAGYVNPPPGFKSRRVLAQEAMNVQLQAELAELQRLREQEAELRFELFKAQLSDEQRAELKAEAATRVQPRSAVSRERQMETYRDEVLREWFEGEGLQS